MTRNIHPKTERNAMQTTKENKPKSQKERRALVALNRSLRNSGPMVPNSKMKRRAQRAAARKSFVTRAELETKNVDELRAICAEMHIKTTTKLRKRELIEMLIGR